MRIRNNGRPLQTSASSTMLPTMLVLSACFWVASSAMLADCIIASRAFAQRQHHKSETAPVPAPGAHRQPQIKPDMLTLRYKPQAGTLLYDVHTEIDQYVHTNRDVLNGVLRSEAQLAFHNVSIDYKKGLWSFDESFTDFQVTGHDLSGDSLLLQENYAVNRVTQLTYDMRGNELSRTVQDTLKLLNAEAQTNAYFFEPPRMLIPLPEHTVTYGDTWTEHREDTIPVHDTVNTGTTTGAYIYDVSRTYRFARLLDTMDRYLAVIVATDTGTFQGFQTNSVTNVMTKSSGPISGADTTILDLFAGCVIKRTLDMNIPTQVKISSDERSSSNDPSSSSDPSSASQGHPTTDERLSIQPFKDILTVHSIITLDESNAKLLQNGQ